jgi:hypothetical protein
MARWLQDAPADVRREERAFTPDPLPGLMVFYQRPFPKNAVDAARLTTNWIEAAKRQLSTTPLDIRARALRHALGFGPPLPTSRPPVQSQPSRRSTVIVAGIDAELEKQLRSARFTVKTIDFTPFDADEAAKIPMFDTYNRTAASQKVADIVDALRASPDAILVAAGDAAVAGLFALTVEHERRAILDVDDFDTEPDSEFVERFYIPGLRRAGDISTAAALAGDRAVIHGAGEHFTAGGAEVKYDKLTPKEIIALLRQ